MTYFFQNLIGNNHFAMTNYVIGSFFPALAARDRVNPFSHLFYVFKVIQTCARILIQAILSWKQAENVPFWKPS